MATTKKSEETKTPVLKKRTTVDEVVEKEKKEKTTTDKMPLKKRELPTETKPVEKKASPVLKKRELPGDTVKTPKKTTKANPLDSPIFAKKVTEEENKPAKEKSSLDKMRERIMAQKKLEQDIMAEQALHNQEKDKLRGKLSALSKSLEEDAEEETEVRVKPSFDFDLKNDALESQNKKLKQDLEKQKQQLQALLALEFHNMKVLDSNSMTLSNDFIEAINSIKEAADSQKDNEEQTLKDELSNLQKELSGLKAKNVAAQKASEDAQKVAAQAQRAVTKAKKAIEEQENDQTRDFKKEIADLEKNVKDKEKQLADFQIEKENLVKENEEKVKEIKTTLETEVKELNKNITSLQKQIDKLTEFKENLTKEKQDLVKENKVLSGEITKANEKIEHAKALEKENTTLNTKVNELDEKVKSLETEKETLKNQFKEELDSKLNLQEEKLQQLEKLEDDNKSLLADKEKLTKDIEEQSKKIDELLIEYQSQLDEKNQEILELRNEVKSKEQELLDRPTEEIVNEKNKEVETLNEKIKALEEENKLLPTQAELDKLNEELTLKETSINELKEETNNLKEKINSLEEENKLLPTQAELDKLNETLQEKEENINSLNIEITSLKENIKALEEREPKTVEVVKENDTELQEKYEHYKNLLLSERNSHLQVEQKLCKDLDEYKAEIEKLQAQITTMSSNYGLNRLNQQVDAIEQFVNDMKENNKADVNRDVYNSYYEKLLNDYRLEHERFVQEIDKRNKMLALLRDEKVNIVEILKRNGKNTSVLEQQISDINTIINKKLEATEVVNTKDIETEILNNIKEDLIKYCETVKTKALKDLEEIDSKYNNATNVSGLIKFYNEDCDNITHLYGNEIVRLNLERELNKDENKQKAIGEKILMLEKQYDILTKERDSKFNQAMSKLRKQNFEVTKEQLESNYFAFVGEEYIKSLNQYADMKNKVMDKINIQKDKFNQSIESLKAQEADLLQENKTIKEKLVTLSSKDKLDETEILAKNQLLTSLKNNELKLENIKEYGFKQTEKDNNFIISELEEDLKNIIDEEKKLKELYAQRESEAKSRLEIEQGKVQAQEESKTKQLISDYVYIQGEADRVILSVDEKRQELLDAQEVLNEISQDKLLEKENEEEKSLEQEIINDNEEEVKPKKENYRIPQDENIIIKEVVEEKTEPTLLDTSPEIDNDEEETNDKLGRIRIEDNLDQKDLPRIKELESEVRDLQFNLSENEDSLKEMQEKYESYVKAEQKMANGFKEVYKYKDALKNKSLLRETYKTTSDELSQLDPKKDKKAYKTKSADLKSTAHKIEYFEGTVTSLAKKQHVQEYIKLIDNLIKFKNQIQDYIERDNSLKEKINTKLEEITQLKG